MTTETTTTDNDLITPRSTKQIFGEDDIIIDDHDAPDTGKSEKSIGDVVDDDIKRMSLHTMKLLDSLTDEVMNEMATTTTTAEKTKTTKSSSRGRNNNNTSSSRLRQRSISPSSSYSSSSDNNYNNDDVDNDNNNNQYSSAHDMALSSPEPSSRSKPQTMKTPRSGNTSTRINSDNNNSTTISTDNAIRHIDDIDLGHDDDDDDSDLDDDMSFDGSIGDDSILNEMEKLNRVAEELQQELSTQDQLSLETKLIELQNSPKPTLRQRIVDNNDRAIINKILQEEEDNMIRRKTGQKSQKSLTDWEKVLEKIDGIWTEQKTLILSFAVTMIWSLIFGLVYKSLYDELI